MNFVVFTRILMDFIVFQTFLVNPGRPLGAARNELRLGGRWGAGPGHCEHTAEGRRPASSTPLCSFFLRGLQRGHPSVRMRWSN